MKATTLRIVITSAAILTSGLVVGCLAHWQKAAMELDKVAKYVEEFGTVTVSEPLLIENKGQFTIKYDRPVKEYVDSARTGVQGAVRRSSQETLDVQSAFRVRADLTSLLSSLQAAQPEKSPLLSRLENQLLTGVGTVGTFGNQLLAGAASIPTLQSVYDQIPTIVPLESMTPEQKALHAVIGTALSQAASATPETPSGGTSTPTEEDSSKNPPQGAGPDTDAAQETGEVTQTPPAFESLLPLDRPAKDVLSSQTFTAPLEIGDLPKQISERKALLIGVNDKATENILKYFLNPGRGAAGDKRAFFAVLQISCNPGWRTRSGYIAEANVKVSYAKEKADWDGKGSPVTSSRATPGRPQPFIVSVFPMLESQTLDLRNSIRSQIALATQLGVLLSAAGADAQSELLADYARRLEYDAATRNAIPLVTSYSNGTNFGYQIRPVFQALEQPADIESAAGRVLHPTAFPAVIMVILEKSELKPESEGGGGWTDIEFMVNARWSPAKRRWFTKRYCETKQLKNANRLDGIREHLIKVVSPKIAQGDGLDIQSHTAQELLRRYKLYESLGQGVTRFSELPLIPSVPSPAAITRVEPSEGWINADTALAIRGDNFAHSNNKSIVKQVIVGGVNCEFIVAGKKSIVALVPAGAFDGDPNPQDVTVVTTLNTDTKSGAVSFTRTRNYPPPDYPNITVTRDAEGRVTGIEIDGEGGATTRELLNAIRSILERENCCDNVEINFSASGSAKKGT